MSGWECESEMSVLLRECERVILSHSKIRVREREREDSS